DPGGKVVAPHRGNLVVGGNLAGTLGLVQQILLKAGVADGEHRGDHLGVGLAAQIRDAVLGDNDIPEVAGQGGIAVGPEDVGPGFALAGAGGGEGDDGAGAGEGKGLGGEVVLAADTADHLTVGEAVGDHGPQQGGHHRLV